jgi:competence protein ComEC
MAFATSRGKKRSLIARHPEKALLALVSACLLGAALALFAIESHQSVAVASAEQPLRVWFLDVGQGDATFIELPTGEQILVDGGQDDAVLTKLGEIMPPWDRTIDILIASHPDADHIGGLVDVIDRYQISAIYDNGDRKDTHVMDRFVAARDAEPHATYGIVRAGQTWTFGDVSLQALWPNDAAVADEDANVGSIALLLTYGDTTVLIPGDATSETEEGYADRAVHVDALRTGHHGSRTSTSERLLDAITPDVAVISCGLNNRYGHPHAAVLGRLAEHGIPVLRTDQDGDILLTSTGGEPQIVAAPLPF